MYAAGLTLVQKVLHGFIFIGGTIGKNFVSKYKASGWKKKYRVHTNTGSKKIIKNNMKDRTKRKKTPVTHEYHLGDVNDVNNAFRKKKILASPFLAIYRGTRMLCALYLRPLECWVS